MTSSSAPRPGAAPSDTPRPADPVRPGDGPPAEAVSLAVLIDDAGPLPADAALECVQRLAERLSRSPRFSCAGLGPADVLIDDDGDVWLRPGFAEITEDAPAAGPPGGIDRLGRLLAFLATGDGGRLADGGTESAAELPAPLSTVAARLFSRNGACYRSYAELAADAALLRGVAPPAVTVPPAAAVPQAVETDREFELPPEPPVHLSEAPAAATAAAELPLPPTPQPAAPALEPAPAEAAGESRSESGSGIAAAMVIAALAGAIAAAVVWQML